MSRTRESGRCGWTMLELAVVLAVVGLLVALILPAILASREAARRTQCSANLKQIGIALGNYVSTHQMFPMAHGCRSGPLVELLPHLEQQNLYDRFNWKAAKCEDVGASVVSVEVPLFYCPSDNAPRLLTTAQYAGTNYLGNAGSGVQVYGYNGVIRYPAAVYPGFDRGGPVRLGGLNDGLSNTAAFAEARRATGEPDRLTTVWQTPDFYPARDLVELERFASACEGIPPHPPDYGWRGNDWAMGHPWIYGDMGSGLYTHVLPPNRPSCYNSTSVQLSAITAGSLHGGGVNMLLADGRVEFVADSIDRGVWRAYGSWVDSALVNP